MKNNNVVIFAIVLLITILFYNFIDIDTRTNEPIYDKEPVIKKPAYNNSIIHINNPICTNIDNKCYNNNNIVNNDAVKLIKENANCQFDACPIHSFCYLGHCICHPGYTGLNCDIRLKYDNGYPYNILDCPNLRMNNTIDIDTPLESLGGEYAKIQNKTLCNSPTNPKFCSYLCYSHNTYGVAVVPKSLWLAAQSAEGDLWKQAGLGPLPSIDANDRSNEHWSAFDHLHCLENNVNFGSVIEVGSGPWTQIKGFLHIRPDIKISKLTIWEPSALRYMKEVPSCSYKAGSKLAKYGLFKGLHDFEVIVNSKGGELLENSEFVQYDTLISINVIEHVQDAFKYFNGLYKAMKIGGLLIFHDRYYDDHTVVGGDHYHPIRIKKVILDIFLSGFTIIYNNCTASYDGRKGEYGYYVIAKKL